MCFLTDLQNNLSEFWALPYHQNQTLQNKLNQVQTWQRERILTTHQTQFSDPNYQPMAKFLIEQLYGGEKFATLAKQLELIAKKGEKVEKFIPDTALATGVAGVNEAIFAVKLDLQLAEYLLKNDLIVNEENIIQSYRMVNAKLQREQQIAQLKQMCYQSDKYLKSFILQKTFTLAKPLAYKHHFDALYDFIADGFLAMKPIKNMADFIEPFCQKELQIIENVHNNTTNPFNIT